MRPLGRCSRVAWLVAVLAVGGAGAATPHAYWPYATGVRLRYETRTTLQTDAVLHWSAGFKQAVEGPPGGQVVTVRLSANRWAEGQPVARDEQYLIDPRGWFTPWEADGDQDYGPRPLLPSAGELGAVDTLWHYEGSRHLPFALHLLGLIRDADVPQPAGGSYHVLSVGPLVTAVGDFPQAVQVTGIERVPLRLLNPAPEIVVFRARRWYVPGLGLVREGLECLDLPRLGRLTTELVGYEGVRLERGAPAGAVTARAGGNGA